MLVYHDFVRYEGPGLTRRCFAGEVFGGAGGNAETEGGGSEEGRGGGEEQTQTGNAGGSGFSGGLL